MKCLILLCLVALVKSGGIWRQCPGTGILYSMEIQGCNHVPCLLKKGADTSIKMDFITPVNIRNLGVKILAYFRGFWLPFTGSPTEGCDDKGCKCPLKAGGRYQFEKTVHISTSFPSVTHIIRVSLMDDDGNPVACADSTVRYG